MELYKVLVDGKEVIFKVDSGVKVTVLAENILTQLNLKKLRKLWMRGCYYMKFL